jgi:hypothetical protein
VTFKSLKIFRKIYREAAQRKDLKTEFLSSILITKPKIKHWEGGLWGPLPFEIYYHHIE